MNGVAIAPTGMLLISVYVLGTAALTRAAFLYGKDFPDFDRTASDADNIEGRKTGGSSCHQTKFKLVLNPNAAKVYKIPVMSRVAEEVPYARSERSANPLLSADETIGA